MAATPIASFQICQETHLSNPMNPDLAWIFKLILVSFLLALGIKTLGVAYPLPKTPVIIISLLLWPTGLMGLVLAVSKAEHLIGLIFPKDKP